MCHVRERVEVCTGFWWGNLTERFHLVDSVIDERIILKWVFKKLDGVMDCVGVDQNRDRWRALVNVVMNRRFL